MERLDRLTAVLEQSPLLGEQLAAARALQTHLQENEVTVSVIGQFKRGKSSLINALLGEELLPVAIIPLTTVVTELRFAETFRAEVVFTDGTRQAIAREALAAYCSEQENPGNRKHVDAVRLWTPKQPFGPGTVLVDTPGVGSVHRHNTASSWAYVERSDAVIFLLSVDSPVSETERDFLLRAGTYAARFFFAVNKADTVSDRDLETFLSFCGRVIGETLGEPVCLRPVSARTGAGVQELAEALGRELEGSGRAMLAASAEKKLRPILDQSCAKLTAALQAARLPEEAIGEKLSRIGIRREELDTFAEDLRVLARHRTALLVDRIGQRFDTDIAAMDGEVTDWAERYYAEHRDLPARTFAPALRDALEVHLEEKLRALHADGLVLLEEGYQEITGALSRKAADAGHFAAALLKEEFGLDYPVEESCFAVSARSDFVLHLGAGGTLLLDTEVLDRLLPRRAANERVFRRALAQAKTDIRRNRNNMLYNYRYKMQESLRTLVSQLAEQVQQLTGELDTLAAHISSHLHDAEEQRTALEQQLSAQLSALRELDEV